MKHNGSGNSCAGPLDRKHISGLRSQPWPCCCDNERDCCLKREQRDETIQTMRLLRDSTHPLLMTVAVCGGGSETDSFAQCLQNPLPRCPTHNRPQSERRGKKG